MIDRIIIAVCKHIMTNDSLPSAGITIRIDESADVGVVIAGLQIIELGIGIVVITTVAQGVDGSHTSCGGENLAIGVIFVAGNCRAAGIDQADDITLEVENVVINCAVVVQGIGPSVRVVEKVENCVVVIFPHQQAVVVDVIVIGSPGNLRGAQAILRVVEVDRIAAAGGAVQSAQLAPGESSYASHQWIAMCPGGVTPSGILLW